jgi:hypothetical protein
MVFSFVHIRILGEEKTIFPFQFFEADEQHKHVEAELRSRLAALETEAAQHQAVVDGLTRKYMETIEKLQNDKAKLEVSATICENMLKKISSGLWRLSMCPIEHRIKTFQLRLWPKYLPSVLPAVA